MGQTEKIESESKKWKCKNIFQVEADREDQIAVHHFLQVLGTTVKIGVGIAYFQKASLSFLEPVEVRGYVKSCQCNVKKIDNCLNFQKPQ